MICCPLTPLSLQSLCGTSQLCWLLVAEIRDCTFFSVEFVGSPAHFEENEASIVEVFLPPFLLLAALACIFSSCMLLLFNSAPFHILLLAALLRT